MFTTSLMRYYIDRAKRYYRSHGITGLIEPSLRFIEQTLVSSEKYYHIRYQLKYKLNPKYHKYNNLAHPLKIIYVDPHSIERISPSYPRYKWRNSGQIRGGEWDQKQVFFDSDYRPHKSFINHFKKDVPWEKTEIYLNAKTRIANGKTALGVKDEEDVLDELKKYDRIYKDIKKSGYKSQKEILNTQDSKVERREGPYLIRGSPLEKYDEVAVDIGRDGSLLFVDGRHRLSIAKILDLKEIPVRPVRRHKKWQIVREKIKDGEEVNEDYYNHPDIKYRSG